MTLNLSFLKNPLKVPFLELQRLTDTVIEEKAKDGYIVFLRGNYYSEGMNFYNEEDTNIVYSRNQILAIKGRAMEVIQLDHSKKNNEYTSCETGVSIRTFGKLEYSVDPSLNGQQILNISYTKPRGRKKKEEKIVLMPKVEQKVDFSRLCDYVETFVLKQKKLGRDISLYFEDYVEEFDIARYNIQIKVDNELHIFIDNYYSESRIGPYYRGFHTRRDIVKCQTIEDNMLPWATPWHII
jgi:hypothetical protein